MWRGGGWLESNFGRLRYRAEDYIVIPRGTIYRLVPDDVAQEDYLILESLFPVRIPARHPFQSERRLANSRAHVLNRTLLRGRASSG